MNHEQLPTPEPQGLRDALKKPISRAMTTPGQVTAFLISYEQALDEAVAAIAPLLAAKDAELARAKAGEQFCFDILKEAHEALDMNNDQSYSLIPEEIRAWERCNDALRSEVYAVNPKPDFPGQTWEDRASELESEAATLRKRVEELEANADRDIEIGELLERRAERIAALEAKLATAKKDLSRAYDALDFRDADILNVTLERDALLADKEHYSSQALLYSDMLDYLGWVDNQRMPKEVQGADFLVLASDGTNCWSKNFKDAVRVAMEHDKNLLDAARKEGAK